MTKPIQPSDKSNPPPAFAEAAHSKTAHIPQHKDTLAAHAPADATPSCLEGLLAYLESCVQWIQDLCAGLFASQTESEQTHQTPDTKPVDWLEHVRPYFDKWRKLDHAEFTFPCRIFLSIDCETSDALRPIFGTSSLYHPNSLRPKRVYDQITNFEEFLESNLKHRGIPLTKDHNIKMGLYAFSKGSEPGTFNLQLVRFFAHESPTNGKIVKFTDAPLSNFARTVEACEILPNSMTREKVFTEAGEMRISDEERSELDKLAEQELKGLDEFNKSRAT